MPKISLQRGDDAIAFENTFDSRPALPPASESVLQIVQTLINKARDLEIAIEGKVNIGEIKSQISIGSELIKIQAEEVAVIGNFTVVDLLNDQNGTTTGVMPVRLTRIIGDLIQTGAIISNNFGAGAGTQIDLDNATIIMGGSASPKFDFDGVNLTIEGSITTGSLFAGDINTSGSIFSDGSTTDAGDVATFIAKPTTDINGFFASVGGDFFSGFSGETSASSSGRGVSGVALSGSSGCAGVSALSAAAASEALRIQNSLGGNAVVFASPKISGDVNFLDDVDIDLTLIVGGIATFSSTSQSSSTTTGGGRFSGGVGIVKNLHVGGTFDVAGVSTFAANVNFDLNIDVDGVANLDVTDIDGTLDVAGVSTFNSNVIITGNSNLDVDRSCHLASDGTSGDSAVRIGVSTDHGDPTNTGHNVLIIAETTGGGGTVTNGQIQMFAKKTAANKTTVGFIAEQPPVTIGTFTPSHKWSIFIQGVEYEIQLDQK